MILYTPLSQDDIFPTTEDVFSNRQCISYAGKTCYVEKNNNGEFQLIQLLSTDPQDFLNENFTPGTIIG